MKRQKKVRVWVYQQVVAGGHNLNPKYLQRRWLSVASCLLTR
jgi:hypothetical protein